MKSTLKTLLRTGRAPIYLSWTITNHCNLRCEYCACPDIAGKELSTNQCLQLLDGMAAAGTRYIKFTGGEPMVRRDLPILLERAASLGISTSLNSNGTLIPRKIEALRHIDAVALSLDGGPDVHEQHRGEGQCAEVDAACVALLNAGIKTTLQCLVTSRTTPDSVDYVLKVAERYGCTATFQPALDIELGTNNPNPVTPETSNIHNIMKVVEKQRLAGRPVGQSKVSIEALMAWPTKRPLPCIVGRFACRLDVDGYLTPCHERQGDLPPVNAVNLGFVTAFQQIKPAECTECWGSRRVEMRMASQLQPSAVWAVLRP